MRKRFFNPDAHNPPSAVQPWEVPEALFDKRASGAATANAEPGLKGVLQTATKPHGKRARPLCRKATSIKGYPGLSRQASRGKGKTGRWRIV